MPNPIDPIARCRSTALPLQAYLLSDTRSAANFAGAPSTQD
jgi:hypothetical protein